MDRLLYRSSKTRRRFATHTRAGPLAIYNQDAAEALLGALEIERASRRSEQALLSERAGAVASALERRANASAAYLRASAALFTIRDGLPGTQFRRFVGELWLDSDYRGTRGIGWAPRIERNELDAFDR